MATTAELSDRTILTGDRPAERERLERLIEEHGSPLLVFDPSVLQRQYETLVDALPGVDLYYAVKAHPNAHIVRTLDELGAGFDVASSGEMDLLLELRISGRRTIHTHPVKKDREIRDALRFGATTFVVDNLEELRKLAPYRKRVGVLLRVSFRAPSARIDLSRKFGCTPYEVSSIVRAASELGVHIRGLSFHVGSQVPDADKHVEAIYACAQLMISLNERLSSPLATLDIGGGFPADYRLEGLDLHAFCRPIRRALRALPSDWHLMAEPGRCLIAPAVRSVTTITGRSSRAGHRWYFVDDGAYGSYSGQVFDRTVYPLQVFRDGPTAPSMIAGPTCDSIDMIAEDIPLPALEVGDLLIGHQMGAYTAATKTRFNSLPDARFVVDRVAVDPDKGALETPSRATSA
ncbi:MAG: type III PLP-dependent enzyme [Pseudomonadota bacterium]